MGHPVTATIGHEQYYTKLTAGTHTVYVDEPLDKGGKDLAPGPGEYLRMALASCTAITLRMYANRKGWNIEKIEVTVSSEESGKKNIYKRHVFITGVLDDQQRKRMIQIANACPVHKILTNPIEVETLLSTD